MDGSINLDVLDILADTLRFNLLQLVGTYVRLVGVCLNFCLLSYGWSYSLVNIRKRGSHFMSNDLVTYATKN